MPTSPKTPPRSSIFINVAAWLLLLLMVVSGISALFSVAGVTAQEFKLGKLELKTTSTSVLVMVIASVPLWTILSYALRGKIQLFDDATNPPGSWIERFGPTLRIVSGLVALVGIATLIWLRRR